MRVAVHTAVWYPRAAGAFASVVGLQLSDTGS
jgi:hypothetical protein